MFPAAINLPAKKPDQQLSSTVPFSLASAVGAALKKTNPQEPDKSAAQAPVHANNLEQQREQAEKDRIATQQREQKKKKINPSAARPATFFSNSWWLFFLLNVLISALLVKLKLIATIASLPVTAQLTVFFVALLAIELAAYQLILVSRKTTTIKTQSQITPEEATKLVQSYEQDHSFAHKHGFNPLLTIIPEPTPTAAENNSLDNSMKFRKK